MRPFITTSLDGLCPLHMFTVDMYLYCIYKLFHPINNFEYCFQEISQGSINQHYQNPVASNQVVVGNVNVMLFLFDSSFVLICSKHSTRNSVQGARSLRRCVGGEGLITLDSELVLGDRGCIANNHPNPLAMAMLF